MARSKPASRAGRSQANKPKTTEVKKRQNASLDVDSTVSFDLQQKCLDVFCNALQPLSHYPTTLQEVKGHLYNRDFATAFGKEEYLQVYAGRWSPSRAVGYLQVLQDFQERLTDPASTGETFRVVCLGGGAGAEVVSLGAWLSTLRMGAKLNACFVDIAAWHNVVDLLHDGLVIPPVLSDYASSAAKESNTALLSAEDYTAEFLQQDALNWSDAELSTTINKDTNVVTLMFTLNELYTASVPKTQALLAQLTAALAPDAHLLVVDSPGSYSTVQINGAEKKYPMQWLLDYTLLNESRAVRAADERPKPKWEKVVSEDSKWFRLPPGLQYPIELENMRYQIHLYRRLADGGDG